MPCDEPAQSEGLYKLEKLDIKAALLPACFLSSVHGVAL